ncbi:PREDICTED: receptor-like serine/threonine-protein kinase ALE2 isoform X1 [Populus euphratica]|uniref:Receptor-like serine/threonine-protein kinase ALE2 isoform X1 n=1 Tax=Populus euphratica TaxID=75702 RepID=A0AAJ6X8R0_POPEU|nr:PREDICTED: receptor-like serine/threonine-protein kinase ALE2 isoform X1 [Populus euphratica]XP_011009869.1 PREDICTED: receptor-like serine/threonine-protein kinase ALE2 isoform X1 [Populus euphratica]XP_011009870.1 PREDICTED: receptor-like serine/threonine-protein kinase ALE2 isoform X1 [Populus euphratica]
MGLVMVPPILQLLGKLSAIGFFFTVQGSTADNISPTPAIFSDIPPIEGTPGPQLQPFRSSVPASEALSTGSNLHPPLASPPLTSAPVPQTITGHVPSCSPSPLIVTKPHNRAPPPLISQGHVPSLSPSFSVTSPTYNTAPPPTLNQGHEPPKPPIAHQREAAVRQTPVSASSAPAAAHSRQSPENSPFSQSNAPEASSPSTHKKDVSFSGAPVPNSVSPAASQSRKSKENQLSAPPIAPATMPSAVPVVSPMGAMSQNSPATHPVMPGESPAIISGPNVPHPSAPTPSIDDKKDGIPVSAPPNETPTPLSPMSHFPAKGSFSGVAPSAQNAMRHSNDSPISPSSPKTPLDKQHHSSAPSPSIPFHKQNHESSRISESAPASSNPTFPPSSKQQGPVMPPSFLPTSRHKQYAFSPLGTPDSSNNASHYRYPKPVIIVSPTPSPSQTTASGWAKMPALSPKASPSGFSSRTPQMPPLPPLHTLPPPPPNEDCSMIVCTEPYTNTPPGSPCRCVLPMQVGLGVSVALYTFFPLVSELAQEIAAGVYMKQSQVRIIGANAPSQQPEKTIVLIDLVPLGERFDNSTAFLTYQRFWKKQVVINPSFFGDYEVLYVRYLGLPPPPPMAPFGIAIIDDGPYSGNDNNARMIKPLGVDVHKRKRKDGLTGGVIAIIAVSGSVALVLFSAVALALWFKHGDHASQPASVLQPLPPSVVKPSGIAGSLIGSGLSSASLSFASSIPAYTGSAKTFSKSDIERATSSFDASRILGEGGFGLVYSGVLEDGTKVAVKVLKRNDHQGGREFLAEVEMLSRLHHRNLVKLIGICTEECSRSLVYELIANGSVESHLHGVDKESALNWDARIKIALGAARGLAYLHEDSSPRVIHRDFKSSNILLEHDFTPKVSDFGLARTALDEENRHISTQVMGTFGYVAPEYAMTGHLLVKSDVYSYGVVLLELLTGRKPVDMSQPPGQENLVAWARPFLTTKEGLEVIIDPTLAPDVPFDSVAKVAAIASMCVQPEVSHRPFMSEVVQALKLVSNECDEAKELDSRSSSQDLSIYMDAEVSAVSGQLRDSLGSQALVHNYDSEPDIERGHVDSYFFSTSDRYGRQGSGSLRRCSSGPLKTGRSRMRLTAESVSERGTIFKMWPGSH